jgi:hypothetical protein
MPAARFKVLKGGALRLTRGGVFASCLLAGLAFTGAPAVAALKHAVIIDSLDTGASAPLIGIEELEGTATGCGESPTL